EIAECTQIPGPGSSGQWGGDGRESCPLPDRCGPATDDGRCRRRRPPAAASSRHASRPCGEVTFEYSAALAQPGEAMDMDLFLGNCSHRPERLRVQVRSHGPCRFSHQVAHTYSFPAQSGVEQSALMLVPSCKGRYSAHVKLTLAGQHRALDVASDGFVVHQHQIRSLLLTRRPLAARGCNPIAPQLRDRAGHRPINQHGPPNQASAPGTSISGRAAAELKSPRLAQNIYSVPRQCSDAAVEEDI